MPAGPINLDGLRLSSAISRQGAQSSFPFISTTNAQRGPETETSNEPCRARTRGNKPVATIRFGRIAPCLEVQEIQAAYRFYSNVLDLHKVFANGTPVGSMALKKDDAELHISLMRDHRASTTNVAHMFVDDVAALYAVCQSAGVLIIKSLAHKDYGQDAFVFADLDGNRIDVGRRTS